MAEVWQPPHSNRGAALITVLLVLAIATVIAVSAAVAQQLAVRKTQNMLNMEQAWQYALGLELWAQAVLDQDGRANDTDSSADAWQAGIPDTVVPGGHLRARIQDMQSRFNINNLLRNGEVSQFDLDRFQRLLQLLEIDADLANAVLDWMDADADSRFPGGAEDDVYMNRQPSHRAANRLFADKAELQLVEGVNAAIYQRLAPHVVALPDYTAINVNTATATSLAILADHLTRQDGEQLIRDRQDQPIENISEWLDQPLFEDGNLTPEGLGVASDYFQVLGEVQVAQRQLRHETLLYRGKGRGTRVVQRSRRGFFDG